MTADITDSASEKGRQKIAAMNTRAELPSWQVIGHLADQAQRAIEEAKALADSEAKTEIAVMLLAAYDCLGGASEDIKKAREKLSALSALDHLAG